MLDDAMDDNCLYLTGNAEEDGSKNNHSGWFVGHFISPEYKLRFTRDVEVKWGIHQENEVRESPSLHKNGITLTLLISGSFVIFFPDLDRIIKLQRSGDYVIFAPSVAHTWKALTDSVILTIRWPSRSDKKSDQTTNHYWGNIREKF